MTVPFTPGFHGLTAPVALIRARLFRATPLMWRNAPPTYHPPAPSDTIALIVPSTSSGAWSGLPEVAWTGMSPPVAGPTRLNSPPR